MTSTQYVLKVHRTIFDCYNLKDLTFFSIVEDLHLAFLRAQEGLCQLGQGTLHGARPHQELTGAGLLHDFCPAEAKHLAEALIAVDDATVLHLSVGDQEPAIWEGGREQEVQCT